MGRAVLTVISYLFMLQSCLVRLPQYDTGSSGADGQGSGDDLASRVAPPEDEGGEQYPDWSRWDAGGSAAENDSHNVLGPDLSLHDGLEGVPAWSWECGDLPLTRFSETIYESSFMKLDQQEGDEDKVFVYPATCGFEESKNAPDTTYLVGIRNPASLGVEVRCTSECYLYLMKGGCLHAHIQGCWHSGTDRVHFLNDVMPGLYLIAVEFIRSSDRHEEPAAVNSFDIHVSINQTLGQEPCVPETVTAWTNLEAAGGVGEVSGTLDWSRGDDFFVNCPSGGYEPGGKQGGMPDTAHALVGDFQGKQPRKFSVELSFLDEEPKWIKAAVLAIGTTPCGKQSTIIDCTWGNGDQIRLEDLWIFPGEELYALVDLSGMLAFDLDGPLSYVLTWTLEP